MTERHPSVNRRRLDVGTGQPMVTSSDDGSSQPPQRVMRLPATLAAPALARQQARAALAAWGCGRVDDVQLVCSELVTNAVIHTSARPTLLVSHADGLVRVEVHDDALSVPVIKTDGAPIGGLGLPIVAKVSDHWGWAATSTGKLVWAEFNGVTSSEPSGDGELGRRQAEARDPFRGTARPPRPAVS